MFYTHVYCVSSMTGEEKCKDKEFLEEIERSATGTHLAWEDWKSVLIKIVLFVFCRGDLGTQWAASYVLGCCF